jgi:transposase
MFIHSSLLLPQQQFHTREEEECERKLRWCLELRTQGKTHLQIAQLLGIGKTTVGRWIKQYG